MAAMTRYSNRNGWTGPALFVAWLGTTAVAAAGGPLPCTSEALDRGLNYGMVNFPQPFGYLGFGCGFADLDGDSDADVIVLGGVNGQIGVFENDGIGFFTNRAPGSGLPPVPQASAFAAGDYDGDGDLDLYVTQLGLTNYLLRNDGDFRFTDVTEVAQVGDLGAGKAATWGDFDQDGWIDLYVCNYNGIVPNTANLDNRLYRNLGNGQFEDVSAAQTVDNHGYGFQSVWFDYDRDGDVDLYLSNDRGHLPPLFQPNQLWRNDGGQLINVSEGSGADLGLFSMGVACGDFDGNRWPDLYTTNISGYLNGFNPLFLNQGDGTFVESSAEAGVGQYVTSWGAIFFDFDNDGSQELYVNNMYEPNHLFTIEEGFPCVEIAGLVNLQGTPFVGSSGVSFSSAVADVDGDGDLDLLENNLGSNVQLYINNEGERRHWIRYRLVGEDTNTFAIGGSVDTRTGSSWQWREVLAGGNGYLGQNELIVHVGLGDAVTVDEAVVRWPGGQTMRTLTDLPVDATWSVYPPQRLGDADGDGERRFADYQVLQACFGQTITPGCEVMDYDGNSTIDQSDGDAFLAEYDEPLLDCDRNDVVDLLEILLDPALDGDGDGAIDGCAVPGDATGDGVVDVADLLSIILDWGPCPVPPASCPADLDGSGSVDVGDLVTVIVNWS